VGFDFGITDSWFTFVAYDHFCDPHPYRHVVSRHEVTTIYNHSTVINNYYISGNKTVINEGVGREHIATASHREVQKVSLHDVATANPGTKGDHMDKSGKSLAVFRPVISAKPTAPAPKTAPAPITSRHTGSGDGGVIHSRSPSGPAPVTGSKPPSESEPRAHAGGRVETAPGNPSTRAVPKPTEPVNAPQHSPGTHLGKPIQEAHSQPSETVKPAPEHSSAPGRAVSSPSQTVHSEPKVSPAPSFTPHADPAQPPGDSHGRFSSPAPFVSDTPHSTTPSERPSTHHAVDQPGYQPHYSPAAPSYGSPTPGSGRSVSAGPSYSAPPGHSSQSQGAGRAVSQPSGHSGAVNPPGNTHSSSDKKDNK
jgi:hypothetical protein